MASSRNGHLKIEGEQSSPSTSGKTLSISSSLEIELKHFVLTLRTFVTTKILSVEWNRLLEFIDDSRNPSMM